MSQPPVIRRAFAQKGRLMPYAVVVSFSIRPEAVAQFMPHFKSFDAATNAMIAHKDVRTFTQVAQ